MKPTIITSFFCDNCGEAVFYLILIERKTIFVLCRKCGFIHEINFENLEKNIANKDNDLV